MISNNLIEQVKMAQVDDKELAKFIEKSIDIKVDDLGVQYFKVNCVLKDKNLRKSILEAHQSKFSIHS